MLNKIKTVLVVAITTVVGGCSSPQPKNINNVCDIFRENPSWYASAKRMQKKWGTPIHVPMAMMYQESSFRSDARPPMQYFLGIIPKGRASDAYGYAQAKNITWSDYKKHTNQSFVFRNNFGDALDFMGWFTDRTYKLNKVSKWDAKNQYLNYHEGWGGFKRKSYNKKKWLVDVAKKVNTRSKRFAGQLKSCKPQLEKLI